MIFTGHKFGNEDYQNDGGSMRFVAGFQEFRGSANAYIAPIWAASEFNPITVRLIQGDADLLSRLDIVRNSGLTIDFTEIQFQFGQIEWKVMDLDNKNRWVFPLSPESRGYAKMEEYYHGMCNRAIEVSAAMSDCGRFRDTKASKS